MFDVLCYGAICADQILRVPRLPRPGEGLRVSHAALWAGGNALAEASALQQWGLRVALAGDRIGGDATAAVLRRALQRSGLHTSYVREDPQATTTLCYVLLTPDGERTVLALRDDTQPYDLPPPDLLARCRFASISRYGPATATAAQLAAAAGVRVIAGDLMRPDEPLSELAEVIVTSARLLRPRDQSIEQLMQQFQARRGAAVIVTNAAQPGYALLPDGHLIRFTPPQITPIDSTNAGDLFRAGLVYGLVHNWEWEAIVAFAARAGAFACLREGIAEQPPTLAELAGLG